MPTTFSDNLGATTSYADRNIFFQPSAETAGGVLSIAAGKTWAQYATVAFAAEEGTGIHLAKITACTDAEAESYDVFCHATDPARDSCECRGWLYRQTCKHRDAARAILANCWL